MYSYVTKLYYNFIWWKMKRYKNDKLFCKKKIHSKHRVKITVLIGVLQLAFK